MEMKSYIWTREGIDDVYMKTILKRGSRQD